jgi:hypothetical protein
MMEVMTRTECKGPIGSEKYRKSVEYTQIDFGICSGPSGGDADLCKPQSWAVERGMIGIIRHGDIAMLLMLILLMMLLLMIYPI